MCPKQSYTNRKIRDTVRIVNYKDFRKVARKQFCRIAAVIVVAKVDIVQGMG